MHRQSGARNAVDAAIQTIALVEAGAGELLQERGIAALLLTAAFAVGEHAYMVDVALRDHEARGDELLFADLLEDPDAFCAVAPVALAQVGRGMIEDGGGPALHFPRKPQHPRSGHRAEHLGDEDLRRLVDLAQSLHHRAQTQDESEEAPAHGGQNM